MESASTEDCRYQNYLAVSLILFLVATAVTIVQYKIPTIMVPVMEQFSIDAYTASWLMSVFTFIGIVCALPVGMLSRKFGPKRIILFAVVLVVAASLVGACAGSVELLLVTRALEGVSLVCVIACGPVVIQQCVDPRKIGTASGIWMLGGMLGATVAGVMTPLLYQTIGFQGLWLGYAAFAALAGILFVALVRIPWAAIEGGGFALDVEAPSLKEKLGGDYKVFLGGNTWLFFIPFAIFQIMLLSVLTYAPTSMQQQGIDAALSGFISTLPMLLAIVSSIAFGAIADATHRCKPLCVIGMLAMTLCTPIMLTSVGLPMWAGAIAMGLFAMGVPAVFISAYPKILGDPRLVTVGMGVLTLFQSIGQFLGSLVPAIVLGPSITNWTTCALVLGALGLLGTVLIALCRFK